MKFYDYVVLDTSIGIREGAFVILTKEQYKRRKQLVKLVEPVEEGDEIKFPVVCEVIFGFQFKMGEEFSVNQPVGKNMRHVVQSKEDFKKSKTAFEKLKSLTKVKIVAFAKDKFKFNLDASLTKDQMIEKIEDFDKNKIVDEDEDA